MRRCIGWLVLLVLASCATPPTERRGALHLAELESEGDPIRRASLRLVVQGLDAETAGHGSSAEGLYARAIQVDPNNPFAYVALARRQVELGRFDDALGSLDQAEVLLGPPDAHPGAEAHLLGLRGAALLGKGYGGEAVGLLRRAAELDPLVWGDGTLTAAELR